MDILSNLKLLSCDFLLITNLSGTNFELGRHFHQVLERQNVSIDELGLLLEEHLPQLNSKNTITLPLEKRNIFPSPFSVLFRAPDSVVMIAEDLSRTHSLDQKKYARMKALLDESSDPIFGFKEDGTYLYVNTIFARTLGHEASDIINRTIWDIFPQDEADKRFAVVEKVFNTGELATIEVTIPHHEGDKHFLTTAKPFLNEADGTVDFVICISKDITELRNTQEQLKILRGLIPICSNCKNIKNDQGAWQQLEEYISNHSEAQFSHGLCPDCVRTLYPDITI